MGDKTKIEWASATWNPIVGCEPVSPGCKNCYAARMASRFGGEGERWENLARGGKWTGLTKNQRKQHDKPIRWRRARSIFVCSMSDLFFHGVSDALRLKIFFTMQECTRHRFLVLTKRPREAYIWLTKAIEKYAPEFTAHLMDHIWFGVTVENADMCAARVPILQQLPVQKRFVSCEPLLGPVNLNFWLDTPEPMIDWIIAGGESGPGARPTHPDWVGKLQATARVYGIPFLFKQWGEWSPTGESARQIAIDREGRIAEDVRDSATYPPDAQSSDGWQTMYKVGKQKAGRLFDGTLCDDFPEGMPR
jgi:protein gp37